MDEEISRQEEARRILEAIRYKENADAEEQVPVKPVSHLPAEDANQLQALIAQKLRLNTEESPAEELPNPENIDPISTEQIKVMRKVAYIKPDESKSAFHTFIDILIKSYFEIADSFKIKSETTKSCFRQGHQCAHCGKKIPFAALEEYNKKEKNKESEDSDTESAPPAH